MSSPKIVKVTLVDGNLNVEDAGSLKFSPAKGIRNIQWHLSGKGLEHASFPKGPNAPPAFQQLTGPPGVLTDIAVIADRILSVDNRHFNLASVDEYIYQLRARVPDANQPGGYTYYTTTSVIGRPATGAQGVRTINNPVIINKRE